LRGEAIELVFGEPLRRLVHGEEQLMAQLPSPEVFMRKHEESWRETVNIHANIALSTAASSTDASPTVIVQGAHTESEAEP